MRLLSCVRWRELSLLPVPLVVPLAGAALVSIGRYGTAEPAVLRLALGFALTMLLGHIGLTVLCRTADQMLYPIVALLSGLGLVLVYRLRPDLAMRQLGWIAIGTVAMLVVTHVLRHPEVLRRYKYSAAVAGLLLVALTIVLGVDPNNSGARLWLGIGPFLFQPSEVLKVLLVVFLAAYLDENATVLTAGTYQLGRLRLPPLPYLGPAVVMWGLSLALLVFQRDLGAALLFFGIFVAMLYLGSGRTLYAAVALLAFAAGVTLAYALFAHVRLRVEIWLNPWADPRGRAYQIVQGLIALASGGVPGAGLGFGMPTVIPAVHTDLVYAALGEELGFAGALALLALYSVLVERGMRVALSTANGFTRLAAAGLTSVLAIQTAVILAGSVRLIPLTGITLPFVSYGGSSLLANYLLLGLLLRISALPRPIQPLRRTRGVAPPLQARDEVAVGTLQTNDREGSH